MSTKRFRLTKASKILIVVLVMALIGGAIFGGVRSGFIKTKSFSDNQKSKNKIILFKSSKTKSSDDGTINLSLDEWIG